MKLINNIFNETREISGYTKKEILEIKSSLVKLKTELKEQVEIEEYLEKRFSLELLNSYTYYLKEIKNFSEFHLLKGEDLGSLSISYKTLKGEIVKELKFLANNLLNIKLNARNVKRFLKDSHLLNGLGSKVDEIINKFNDFIQELEPSIGPAPEPYNDLVQIWFEVFKIKNKTYEISELPETMAIWEEVKDLIDYLKKIEVSTPSKKKKKKKNIKVLFQAQDLDKFLLTKENMTNRFYLEIFHLLDHSEVLEEFNEGEFQNVLERKELTKSLKKYFRPIIKELILDELKDIIEEIIKFDNDSPLEEDGSVINMEKLLENKISTFIPKLVDYYFKGLERKYQGIINETMEHSEFKNISSFYSEKIEILNNIIDGLEGRMIDYEGLAAPQKDVFTSLKKILSSISSEIYRRKEEYLFYLKSIKNERLRDNLRNFISEKTKTVNALISSYQDETALIIREEFPQLKQVRKILKDYIKKIEGIKKDIYAKLDEFKEKDIDIYQIIKTWEENFSRKQQQLSFLLSLLLNKLYKNFKDLIESEQSLFENISEIKDDKEEEIALPLNFALSTFLVDKLSEEELDERIVEVKARIDKLTQELGLYQDELVNLEEYYGNRVRLREGITDVKVQCGVCHKNIDFAKAKIIKCPFCGAIYHYLCVAFWLSKYNSCPSCQNQFLDPNSGLFEDQ